VRWWQSTVRRPGQGNNAERGYFVGDAEELTQISQQQVSRWRRDLSDADRYRSRLLLATYRAAGLEPEENHRAGSTHEYQWFTPRQYIEAARHVMGGIDLDPATHPTAQRTVQARQIYTESDDGLARPWHGTVWLNPPFVQPLIAQFVDKLIEEYRAGRTVEAIMLTNNYSDTNWFHKAAVAADLLCLSKGRVKFVDIDGYECTPTQGQAFFYFGPEPDRFADVFRQFGLIAMIEPQP
jgi:DNA N-6-adenine-methyltransferase (Dam)